jgi:hypothetical protein
MGAVLNKASVTVTGLKVKAVLPISMGKMLAKFNITVYILAKYHYEDI